MPLDRNGFSGSPALGVHAPGVYVRMLRESCRVEVRDRQYGHLALMDTNDPERVSGARKAEALAGELFNERVGAGQPVIAWWYWLSDAGLLPLPEPLDTVGSAAGPRRVVVTADDRIEEIQR
jgi:hypothetical protein